MKTKTKSGCVLRRLPDVVIDSLTTRVFRGMKADLHRWGFRGFDVHGAVDIRIPKMRFTISDDDGDEHEIEVAVKLVKHA